MSARSDRMKALAKRMLSIEKFGKGLTTFKRSISTSINPLTLEDDDDQGDTLYYANVAPLDIRSAANLLKQMGETVLVSTDRLVYMENNGTKPIRGDIIVLDDVDNLVDHVEPFELNDEDVAYLLKVVS